MVDTGKAIKAAYSAAVSGLGSLASILSGTATFEHVTEGQWVTVLLATLVAAGGTYGLAGWSGPNGNGKPGG
jgi:hypothetical protein